MLEWSKVTRDRFEVVIGEGLTAHAMAYEEVDVVLYRFAWTIRLKISDNGGNGSIINICMRISS